MSRNAAIDDRPPRANILGGLLRATSTKSQILGAMIVTMSVIIVIAQLLTYNAVSRAMRDEAEVSAKRLAVQVSGRFDAVLKEVSATSLRVAVSPTIQGALIEYAGGGRLSFDGYRRVSEEIRANKPFLNAIEDLELFAAGSGTPLTAIAGPTLAQRVGPAAIAAADAAEGGIAWIGEDPDTPNGLLALRQVRLLDRRFRNGGYMLIRVSRELFSFVGRDFPNMEAYGIRVVSDSGVPIAGNMRPILLDAGKDKRHYIDARAVSGETGWIVELRVPVDSVMEGLVPLRRSVVLTGAIGLVLSVIVSLFVSRFITYPIRRLTAVMERDSRGRLEFNLESYSNREMNELNRIYNEMAERINTLIASVFEKEIAKNRSELRAIQAQINPHFLHNTLEAFYWTLVGKGEEELAAMIIALSDLFRYTIHADGASDLVPLSEEMRHIGLYADLIRFRMPDRIEFEIELDERIADLPIPKLTLQPIVENAVRHGVEPRIGAGKVRVAASLDASRARAELRIADDGVGIPDAQLAELKAKLEAPELREAGTKGIGLSNVAWRLAYHYGPDARPSIESAVGEGTRVAIRIPLPAPEEARGG